MIFEGRLHALGAPSAVLTPQAMRDIYDVEVVVGTLPGASAPSISPKSKEFPHGS